jgi:hypothetical protein
VLKGWKFRYLNGVVAPAELPRTIAAYKNQQARWAKGSTQCLITYGRSILASANQSITARLYATFSMAGYSVHLLMILLLLVQVPLILKGYKPPRVLIILAVLSLAQPFLFVFGQQLLYKDWLRRLLYLPALLIIAIGLAPSNCRAVLEALLGRKNDFIRTPKGKSKFQEQGSSPTKLVGYRLPFDWIVIFELLLALYASAGALICIATANYWPLLFMGACVAGFSYVAFGSIREHRAAREVDTSRVQSMQTPSLH